MVLFYFLCVMVIMLLLCTIARVFTSIQETGDNLVIVGFALAACLNAILFIQFFIYWEKKKQKTQ
ncbi:hypothetical protein DICVIV_07000 [Dictyocaulus viviparus]|uniref:Uncharacterized protein n=1 Tax=Dictyocaulus viviparus TaxID=29172 RepID=A0A0D8XQX2_DICVI|nr:hypothetical protein DICVIV_07000 [Dictyocaulus viviparus]